MSNNCSKLNKYQRFTPGGEIIDVYDILEMYALNCSALQHLVKKALVPGKRGHKTIHTDLQDINDSSFRSIELQKWRDTIRKEERRDEIGEEVYQSK